MNKKPALGYLAGNIAARRRALSLTQAQVAEALEVDTETFARFERGKHLPSLQTLVRLATHLQTSVGELLGGQDLPPPADLGKVTAWLSTLTGSDRAFMLDLIKLQCDFLGLRARIDAKAISAGKRFRRRT